MTVSLSKRTWWYYALSSRGVLTRTNSYVRILGGAPLRAPPFFPGITDVMVSPRKGEIITPEVLRTGFRRVKVVWLF